MRSNVGLYKPRSFFISTTERLADGVSGGMYGSFKDKYMDNSYTNRQDRLRNMAYQAGAGYLHDAANTLLDTDSDIARYYYITKFITAY